MENNKNINLIIQKITGLTKGQLFLNPEVNPKFDKDIEKSIKRFDEWEPIEYIINNAEFYSLDFYVDNRVLIPRDDTEIMVDLAIETIVSLNKVTLIDVWTWSSCIPISILENTNLVDNTYVIDISDKALEVSKINIEKHGFTKKIEQVKTSLLNSLSSSREREYKFNKNIIITANLPYIKDDDFSNIDKETMEFEPALALYWWKETWFELYEKLIDQCIEIKKVNEIKKLVLFIEIGFDQKEYCEKYINKMLLKCKIFKDNSGVERCVRIEF